MPLNFEPVPYEEAARIVAEKQIMSKEAFDALCDELKARAFTVAGLEDLRMVQEIRDAIAEIPMGAAWEDVKRQVADKLEQGGFSEKAADYRATLLLRHHGFAAYAQEKYRELREMQDAFPYWKYQTMGDEKVRSSHAALDGLILPADDPFWRDHFPPWEWNCRCLVVGVTQEEYDAAATAGPGLPTDPDERAAGWKLPPAALDRLHSSGQLEDGSGTPATVARTSSFHFDPSGPGLDMAEIEKRYDPADWAAFRSRMESEKLADGRSVWEWATGKKAAEIAKTHAPAEPEKPRFTDPVVKGDPVCDALGCRKGAPFSIEDAAAIVNPRFKEDWGYQHNCQRCVQAYELARRGYDVEANARPQRGSNPIKYGAELFLARDGSGRPARFRYNMTESEVRAVIAGTPGEARFIVTIRWRGPKPIGHGFIAEKTPGGIRFIDPQSGNLDVSGYFAMGEPFRFGLLRVDDLPLNVNPTTLGKNRKTSIAHKG